MGAVIPPHQSYQARAPIHPKRPYGSTRPVVPPDGSFLFRAFLSEVDTGSREENASKQESRASVLIQSEPKLGASDFLKRRIRSACG
ncbi:hypothetical protein CVM73_01340 [Bradyrhizobium forestalis]|uniref:Uncharacterized protein n=1 Tax=Bradyrhizobium forestalis TaxID=1419263 RepID=A0A2M8RH02_9BRAD|nr:hypothetical protein CVM73_01340 [Bradyrhizobium forestalis]